MSQWTHDPEGVKGESKFSYIQEVWFGDKGKLALVWGVGVRSRFQRENKELGGGYCLQADTSDSTHLPGAPLTGLA